MNQSHNSDQSGEERALGRARGKDLDPIDQASASSFPASDAPATSGPVADDPPRPSGGSVQLRTLLGGIEYPVDKRTLLERARQRGADEDAIRFLREVPQEHFDSPDEVTEAAGKTS